MDHKSIDEIYAANARVRERLRAAVAEIPDEIANARPAGEKWSVAEIVEHVAMVNAGALRICERLLRKAAEANGGVEVRMSDNFLQKAGEIASMKVEAPEMVRPSGARSIRDSLEDLSALELKYAEAKPLFETLDGSTLTFPHPFFGDITAHEWLGLSGGHEARHIKQIEKVLSLVVK
jgi:hypothetical protein